MNNNKTVDIFGTTYTIEYVDKIDSDNDDTFIEGWCNSSKCNIKVAIKYKDGTDIPDDVIKKNLIHELIHAILNEGQYLRNSDDEPLVEWLARCIHSILKQNIL